MAKSKFSGGNFLIRLVAALVLVFATYNPEGFSFYHWAIESAPGDKVLKIFVGVVLLVCWVIFLRATYRSLGPLGTVLAAAVVGTLIWLIVDYGLVNADSARSIWYLALVALSAVLAVGISWSHVRRRITGQLDVDEADI